MNRVISIVLLVLSSFSLNAQKQLDSLYAFWLDENQNDSLRTIAFEEYVYSGYIKSYHDSAIFLADELIEFGIEHSYARAESLGHELKGYCFYYQNNYSKALENFKDALLILESTGREKFSGSLMNTIGVLYGTLGNEVRALEYYERALKIGKELDDKENMEMCVSNIGEIYFSLDNYPRALEYLRTGLELEKEMGDTIGYAMSLNLIADVYRMQGNFVAALDYSKQALRIHEDFNDTEGIASSFFSIGNTYKEQKKYSLALQYFNKGLEFNEGRDSSTFHVQSLNKIGSIYREQGEYQTALRFCKESQELASKLGMLIILKDACECLYLAHRSMNNDYYALEYLEQIRAIDDSLKTQETNNRLQQMEIDKQVLADSIVKAEEARLIDEAHQEEVRQKNRIRNLFASAGILFLILAVGLFGRVRYIRRSKAVLQKEKDRSENLLLNILPEEIAAELKEKGKADARDFETVSILFTDFKEFTQNSEKLTAQELLAEINTCFEAFDQICEKYNVEKIKTIGDSYMAAGGLPVPSNDSVKNTVLAAIEMQKFMVQGARRRVQGSEVRIPKTDDLISGIGSLSSDLRHRLFEMRVGIHTGPVVAGIVGVKKFQYDVWGDTVNTASRMESAGEVGKVNISQTTYEVLKDDQHFNFESRGKIEAKGKGEIEMYFVNQSLMQ